MSCCECPSGTDFLVASIMSDHACRPLPASDVEALAKSMQRFEFKAGEAVLSRGQPSTRFYVVASGCVDVLHGGGGVGDGQGLARGSTVGGRAILSKCSEQYHVVAREESVLFGVEGDVFLKVISENALRTRDGNLGFLDGVPFFQFLPTWVRGRFNDLTPYVEVIEAGEVVCREGQPDFRKLRILKSGKLSYRQAASRTHQCGHPFLKRFAPGDIVAAGTLLPWRRGHPAAATIIAECRSEILCIPPDDLKLAIHDEVMESLLCLRTFAIMGLTQIKVFSGLSRAHKIRLAQAMEVKDYAPGEHIHIGCCTGSVQYAHVMLGSLYGPDGSQDVTLGVGQIFLAPQFFQEQPECQACACVGDCCCSGCRAPEVRDLVAGPDGCKVAVLTRGTLGETLTELGVSPVDNLEDTAELARDMLLASRIPIFRHLSADQVQLVLKSFVPRRYAEGSRVMEQGEVGTSLYVVASGVLAVQINGKTVRTLGKNGSFGDRGLLFEEPRSATVTVLSDSAELWCLEKAYFEQVLTGDLRSELVKRMDLQDTNVGLDALASIRVIGTGGFGRVRMVEHKRTGVRYALKQVRKKGPRGQLQASLALRESELLAEMDHPFTLQLVRTLETPRSVYILTELITGGDLHTTVQRMRRPLSRGEAQFYAGSLLLALEHLHDRSIIYRDLKPDNVMLDARGYIKLIDFGIAKRLDDSGRTFTCLGTPHYMAPEMLRRQCYGTEVDIWALGVLLYALVCRRLPFAHGETDPVEIQKSVLKDKLEFPERCQDSCGQKLIKSLLERRPERRLGAGIDGLDEVKQHPYFSLSSGTCLFDRIIRRELLPPMVPNGEVYSDPDSESDHEVSIAEAVVLL